MALRKIIKIDEEKCDGCGLCVAGCAEGALRVVGGKARLVSDSYCDGLGACLGECPRGALQIIEREAPDFDEEAAMAQVDRSEKSDGAGMRPPSPVPMAAGCPGGRAVTLKPRATKSTGGGDAETALPSALRNWPLQLHLVPNQAPYFKDAELLIAADCCGFSLTGLHRDYLPGKTLIIACPKLDDTRSYVGKLVEIFRLNRIRSVTLLYMVVPCCAGLVQMVGEALRAAGQVIPLKAVKVDMTGQVLEEALVEAA